MTTSQPHSHTNDPITVMGYQVRTDSAGSATTIPALWRDVTAHNRLRNISGRTSPDIYAVYTNLEDSGRSNNGWFSVVIGAPVAPHTPVPDGMVLVAIPRSPRLGFPAPQNDPARITEAWQQAWAVDDSLKTFICEYERYSETGDVSVNIGVHHA